MPDHMPALIEAIKEQTAELKESNRIAGIHVHMLGEVSIAITDHRKLLATSEVLKAARTAEVGNTVAAFVAGLVSVWASSELEESQRIELLKDNVKTLGERLTASSTFSMGQITTIMDVCSEGSEERAAAH